MDTPASAGLREALHAIKGAGSFAAFSKLSVTDLKPISVQDVGTIAGFPLQEAAARQLIEKARQAPYGKGSETFVDTSVRNTWELDASQLHLSRQWASTVGHACEWVAQQLGITAFVRAELYKMLIYEKGAMFKAHTDTEKIPGMFGTLVICLPSKHKGGDLVLKHRDVTKVFKTSETQPSMACWFSDVSHEVLPVTSGIRWVLTYNLAVSQTPDRPFTALNSDLCAVGLDGVQKALSAWLDARGGDGGDGDTNYLYYLLDHTYTESNLSLNALKGADLYQMQCLKDACDKLNVSLFFGLLEKEVQGGCDESYEHEDPYCDYYDDDPDDEDEDEDADYYNGGRGIDRGEEEDYDWHPFVDIIETEISIKRLVAADGRTVRQNLKLDEGELEERLIQDVEDPFKKAEREETDYSGFTGNEGVSATHWYRMTIAVLVPNDDVDRFLTKGITKTDAQSLLPQYLAKCSDSETRDAAMQMVRHLARLAWEQNRDTYMGRLLTYTEVNRSDQSFDVEIALQFVATILRHQEYELFCKALDWFKTKVGAQLFVFVEKAISKDPCCFSQIKDGLLQNLSLRSVAHRMKALTLLGLPSDSTYNPQVGEWAANEVVPVALEVCLGPKVVSASGSAIVDMVKEYRDIEYLKTSLVPVIQKQAPLTPFALGALMRILHFETKGFFDKAVTLELCKPLLKSVLDVMDVANLRTKEGVQPEYKTSKKARNWDYHGLLASSQDGPHAKPETFISANLLAECLGRCIQFGWDDLASLFSLKLAAKIVDVPRVEFHHLWLPFVRELISTLGAANVPLSTPRYQELARAILEAYLDKEVGKEPSGATDYSGLGPVSCSCADCGDLNRFLASGEKVWRFPAIKKRRKHLEDELGFSSTSRFGCSHHSERGGRCGTLVVTKTVDTGAKAKKEWTDRFAQAWDEFGKFDQDKLRVLLGADYERITSMRHLGFGQGPQAQVQRAPPAVLEPRANARNAMGAANLVAGVKRRAGE